MQDPYRLASIIEDEEIRRRFYRAMRPSTAVEAGKIVPQWSVDGERLLFAGGSSADGEFASVDVASGRRSALFDRGKARGALEDLIGRVIPDDRFQIKGVIQLCDDRFRFEYCDRRFVLSRDSYEICEDPDHSERAKPRSYRRTLWLTEPRVVKEAASPCGRWFAGVENGNIRLRSILDDRCVWLTDESVAQVAWDIEAPRLRFGVGMQMDERLLDPWSPNGCWLFATKMDRRHVPDLPIVRFLKREEEVSWIKIQRAGSPMDVAHPHALDVLGKRARRFDLGDTEDQFFTLVGWLDDSSEVLFTRHSRDFKSVELVAGDPASGAVRVVLAERSLTFVALQHDVIFQGNNHVALLPGRHGLIWRSSRSGWHHFYRYGLDGELEAVLTKGDFPVIDVVAADTEAGWLYFTAHHDQRRPYDTHLCRVRLSGGDIERLTDRDGQNAIFMAPSMSAFVVVNSRPDRPYRSDLYSSSGKHVVCLVAADQAALEAEGYLGAEEFEAVSADGETPIWGVFYKPPRLDPSRKYPVVLHVYGGPQISSVRRDFSFGAWTQQKLGRALAQLGFIVVAVDARGTPERSKAFQDVVYGKLGGHEMADQIAALRQLSKRHPYFDLARVGVWGHSWGGYFAIRALAEAPELFRAAVASAPSADPYEAIYYEPYLDLPTRAPAAYAAASLYPLLEKVQGKLLIAAGTADPMFANVVRLTHRLIEARIEHELVVLPEAGHTYEGANDDYFVQKLIRHFATHLRSEVAG